MGLGAWWRTFWFKHAILRGLKTKRVFQIEYVDVKGDHTTRIVLPVSILVTRKGYLAFGAYCFKRHAYRTFAFHQVQAYTVPREVDVNWVDYDVAMLMLDAYGWAAEVAKYGNKGPRWPRVSEQPLRG